MLESTLHCLGSLRVVLASKSPRRIEILKNVGINAESIPSDFDENLDRNSYKNHGDYVTDLAYHKVQEVYNRIKDDDNPPGLVIGADTVVTLGDEIYGKPKDDAHALQILSNLANKENVVYTGVCLKTKEKEIKFFESAKVKFGDVSQEQIKSYIKTGEPRDKAGGYGIQGVGGCLIEKIDGDYFTVTGLPLYRLICHLNNLFN